jgi:soluble calcium-activated nucleotidase 1
MIHESGRWSDVHQMWFFMPRKLSRQPYNEVIDAGKCVNLMLASPEPIAEDGSSVILQKYLGFLEQRGTSEFLFVPGTNDCHLFILRTEESFDGVMSTFASVIDLEGHLLMAEVVIGNKRKFEGAAWVGNWGPFKNEKGCIAPPTAGTSEVCTIA